MKKQCVGCGIEIFGAIQATECLRCMARETFTTTIKASSKRKIFTCAVCKKEFEDYLSNRVQGKYDVVTCSPACRAAWVGVANSIQHGGDGMQRTKAEQDALDYRKHAEDRRTKRRIFYHENRPRLLEASQQRGQQLKQEIIQAYGNACACCGETQIEFLTIDHINGDGAAHRREFNGNHRSVYRDLKRRGFPQDDYRLLCFNCNFALGSYGYCPHNPETMRQTFDKRAKNPGRPRTVA